MPKTDAQKESQRRYMQNMPKEQRSMYNKQYRATLTKEQLYNIDTRTYYMRRELKRFRNILLPDIDIECPGGPPPSPI